MARQNLPRTTPLGAYGDYTTADSADLTLTAANTTDKEQFPASGNDLVVAQNTDAAAQTVTINSVADAFGRTGDISAYSIGAGEIAIFGPFKLDGWEQTDGNIYLEASSVNVKFAVIPLG